MNVNEPPSKDAVLRACSMLGFDPSIIERGNRRPKETFGQRCELCAALRFVFRWSFQSIARHTNYRSHTSVIDAIRKSSRGHELGARFVGVAVVPPPVRTPRLNPKNVRQWSPFREDGRHPSVSRPAPKPKKPIIKEERTFQIVNMEMLDAALLRDSESVRRRTLLELFYMTPPQMAELFGVGVDRVETALRSTGRRPRHGWGHYHAFGRSVVAKVASILRVPYTAAIEYKGEVEDVTHIYEWAVIVPPNRIRDKSRLYGRRAG